MAKILAPVMEIYMNEGRGVIPVERIMCGDCVDNIDEPEFLDMFNSDGEIDVTKWRNICGEHGCRLLQKYPLHHSFRCGAIAAIKETVEDKPEQDAIRPTITQLITFKDRRNGIAGHTGRFFSKKSRL
jgi:hypothetical protein